MPGNWPTIELMTHKAFVPTRYTLPTFAKATAGRQRSTRGTMLTFVLKNIRQQTPYCYDTDMTVADVKGMSIEEKIQIMETIWEDMRDRLEHSDIPQSHKDLLDTRRARVASGDSKLLDWDSVKSSIGRS